jgi:hypothetical protein
MELNRDELLNLKENFQQLNEASGVRFENEKIKVFGPVETKEEMIRLGQGTKWHVSSKIYNYFNDYYYNLGVNMCVIIPKGYPQQKYVLAVYPYENKKEIYDANNKLLSDEESVQLLANFDIPIEVFTR